MSDPTPEAAEPTRMSIAAFRAEGYLQELNRRFLHPLGLALEVMVDDETGEERLGGVWDYRDDPEGMNYQGFDVALVIQRAARIEAEWAAKEATRRAALGYMIQPPDAVG